MKKLLLFLLLFGGGLGLLFYLQDEEVDERDLTQETPIEPRKDEQDGPAVTINVPDGKDPDRDRELSVITSGKWQLIGEGDADPDTGIRPRTFKFDTSDLQPHEDNSFVASDVVLLLYDPETDTVRAEVRANRAYLHLEADSEGRLGISGAQPVRLESVDLTILRGAPITPIHFRVPALDWLRVDGSFASEDRIVLDSPGISAVGTGMRIVTTPGRESITLLRDGDMTFELKDGQKAKLESLGLSPLSLVRTVVDGSDRVRLSIDDGARLTLPNDRVLNAQSLTVVGERAVTSGVDGTETGSFQLTSANALGQVAATTEQGTLHGSEATVEFDQKGSPKQLTVTGNPRAELALQTSATTTTNATIEGAGPLVIALAGKGRFELQGPAVIEWPEEELVVSAQDWLRGTYDEQAEQAKIAAQGAVKISHPEGELSGPSLEITYAKPEPGVDIAHLTVQGPSVFEARDKLGRVMIVEANGELSAHTRRVTGQAENEFILDRAEDVVARLETPVEKEKSFTATCQVLRDVNVAARSMVAEGGVTYEVENVRCEGARLVVKSETDFELFGSAKIPASVSLVGGTGDLSSVDSVLASADYLHVTEMRVEAVGSVEIAVESGARTLNTSADDIAFEWLAAETEDPRPYNLIAHNIRRAGLREAGSELLLSCAQLEVDGMFGDKPAPLELEATGAVRIEAAGKQRELSDKIGGTSTLVGMGESFTWSVTQDDLATEDASWSAGRGRLTTDRGKRVRSVGNLAGERLPYELTADWIEFDRDELRAENLLLRIDSTDLPTSEGPGAKGTRAVFEASAQRLVSTRTLVRLEEAVHVSADSQGNYSWSLDSDELEIRLDLDATAKNENDASVVPSVIKSMVAQGNLSARFNEELSGTGDRLIAMDDRLRLEGNPAHLATADFAWESKWVEVTLRDEVITTGPGVIVPLDPAAEKAWQIRYESLQPFREGEATVLALRNLVVTQGEHTLRSNWALFWIDDEERAKVNNPLMRRDETGLRTEDLTAQSGQSNKITKSQFAPFRGMRDSSLARILNEAYIEGDVEYLSGTERLVRAEAIYIDLVEGHSWIQGADMHIRTAETKGESLRVKAEWVRHAEDGSLRAEEATVTSCSHDVPHYVIEVSNLRMDPLLSDEADNAYRITLDENSLRFQNGLRVPLPGASIESDDEGNLDLQTATVGGLRLPNITFGNSSRFGATVGTQFSSSFGRIGKLISGSTERLFDLNRGSVRGRWNYNASWFGSRGLMLGLGFDIKSGDRFQLSVQADGLPDGDRDRGLVRVPEDQRSTFRGWYRAKGRYYMDDDEWIDMRFTYQTDAGVQSEFFEREFVRFEERETYLHWRKADDQFFYSATVEAKPSTEFTEVQQLPSIGFQRGRTPIAMLGDVPLLYSITAEFEHLNRHNGSQELAYADGFGDQSVSRFDTVHRFETPINLGKTAVRVTPFLEGRGTVWTESQTGEDDPLRAALSGGGEVSMALWKRSSGGRIHTIAPKIGARVTMGVDESGGQPIFFDEIENPVEGHFVDAGVRSVWRGPDPNRYVDLDLTATHASDVAADANGWQVGTYALLRNYLSGMPIAFLHDSRYDIDDSRTDYSRTAFGLRPWDRLEVGTGYNSGRGPLDARLYETATVSARFKATPKWDLEFRQTFNLVDSGDEDLESRFLIRRFGHDMLFELEFRQRAGEGTSFSLGFRPRIGWKRSRLGLFQD